MLSFRHLLVLQQLFTLKILASNEIFARQAVTSYSPAQTTACLNQASSCFPTVASCTPSFCSSCAAVGGPDFVSCCAGTDAANCISTLLATAGGTTTDPNTVACNLAVSLVNSCASSTSGFSEMRAGLQASCLCYTSSGSETVYAPSYYDDAQSGCVAWAKTADTSDFPLFASAEGLCTAVGNVRGASATLTAVGTSTSSTTSPGGSGAVSTRTASITSTTTSEQATGTIVSTSSSAAMAGSNTAKAQWSLGHLLLGLVWLA